eukprot:4215926-Pyramimonas_sp.AAC.1
MMDQSESVLCSRSVRCWRAERGEGRSGEANGDPVEDLQMVRGEMVMFIITAVHTPNWQHAR